MNTGTERSKEIFSFHVLSIPLIQIPQFLLCPVLKKKIPGLRHSESFFTMGLGAPIVSARRYNFNTFAFFAWWSEESYLHEFLAQPSQKYYADAWHVRMKLYRRWGEVKELRDVIVNPELAAPDKPVVAVTLARLKLRETLRFIKWGKPVEVQVREHPGKTRALAGMRPFNTFSTFSIWKNESEMLGMVRGHDENQNEESHKLAMQERVRRDFHYEFTTMRFVPIKEVGTWIHG